MHKGPNLDTKGKPVNNVKSEHLKDPPLTPDRLKELAYARLEDAKALFRCNRCDGAFYICGYAVEMGLKYKICTTLDWDEYPRSGKGSDAHKSFRTHKIEDLLH